MEQADIRNADHESVNNFGKLEYLAKLKCGSGFGSALRVADYAHLIRTKS